MAHAQKPDLVFRRNGRVHLNSRWRQFSRLLGSRGVRISGSNAGYTMFRGSVESTGYPLHSPVSSSLPLPCVTVCHHISTGLYCSVKDWHLKDAVFSFTYSRWLRLSPLPLLSQMDLYLLLVMAQFGGFVRAFGGGGRCWVNHKKSRPCISVQDQLWLPITNIDLLTLLGKFSSQQAALLRYESGSDIQYSPSKWVDGRAGGFFCGTTCFCCATLRHVGCSRNAFMLSREGNFQKRIQCQGIQLLLCWSMSSELKLIL
jgi:hypothetical protein